MQSLSCLLKVLIPVLSKQTHFPPVHPECLLFRELSHLAVELLLERCARSGAVLYSRLDLFTKHRLQGITLQCCLQVIENGFDCLKVHTDVFHVVWDTLDAVDSVAKVLDTMQSCGTDAYNRCRNTSLSVVISRVEISVKNCFY